MKIITDAEVFENVTGGKMKNRPRNRVRPVVGGYRPKSVVRPIGYVAPLPIEQPTVVVSGENKGELVQDNSKLYKGILIGAVVIIGTYFLFKNQFKTKLA